MPVWDVTLAVIGTLILLLGLFSHPIRDRLWVSEPLLALVAGFLIGPALGPDLLPRSWTTAEVVEPLTRLTLAVGLMGVALRLPRRYLTRRWRPLAVALLGWLPLMWLTSSVLIYWILGLPAWLALLIGAIAAPTDPVVASAIVSGRAAQEKIPERLRNLISAESGLNDGLGLPFVMLAVLMLTRPAGDVVGHWLIEILLYQVGLGVVLGALFGHACGKLFDWAENRGHLEQISFLGFTLALTLSVLGLTAIAGTDAILAVFVAGIAFSRTIGSSERHEEEHVQEAFSQFFTLPIFVLIGLVAPWEDWLALGWRGAALVIAILLLRRLPAVLLLRRFVGPLRSRQDALYVGWFGPIGVAAMFYAFMAMARTDHAEIWVVGSLLICGSLVAHGVTATPLSDWLRRQTQEEAAGP